jgi:hypothetical protein
MTCPAGYEEICVSLIFADDTVGQMWVFTRQPLSALPLTALNSGWTIDGGSWVREATEDVIQKDIIDRTVFNPPVKSWKIVPEEYFSKEREYRAALRDSGKAHEVHMPVARELHRDKLREARALAMPALDVEYIRADEAGDVAAKADIAKRKQVLRDITKHPAIEAAQSVEALQAITL